MNNLGSRRVGTSCFKWSIAETVKDPVEAEKHFLASEVISNESIDQEKRLLPEFSC